MGGIINYIISLVTGDLKAIKNWIAAALKASVDFLQSLIDSVWHDAVNLYNDAVAFAEQVARDLNSLAAYVVNFVNHIFSDFVHWAEDGFNAVSDFLTNLQNWIVAQLDKAWQLIDKVYQDIEHWVITEIWQPLWSGLTSALNWIETEGAYILNLLTHPELLAKFLGVWLWHSWLDLLKTYASPIGRWFIHTMLSEESAFADVLETILSHLI